MELIVIGAGPAYTDRRGAAGASYLVRAGDAALVLDLGQGAFPNLAVHARAQRAGRSGGHPPPPGSFRRSGAAAPLPEMGIRSAAARSGARSGGSRGSAGRAPCPARVRRRVAGRRGAGGQAAPSGRSRSRHGRVRHTDESYALRVSVAAGPGAHGGPGLVYSGDCGRAGDLVPLLRPGDTLLSEASFGAGQVPAGAEHLTAAEAGRAATDGRRRAPAAHAHPDGLLARRGPRRRAGRLRRPDPAGHRGRPLRGLRTPRPGRCPAPPRAGPCGPSAAPGRSP